MAIADKWIDVLKKLNDYQVGPQGGLCEQQEGGKEHGGARRGCMEGQGWLHGGAGLHGAREGFLCSLSTIPSA